ncbi:MAG: class I SAM-dependent methyltransferase [Chloroflexi bacterium]|uniref:Class I SAM-dependent methyltransferase n=1 Tax=Candidatus Chlorohelix allophototropha TaxID=3003348 RepID=A0A8T7M6E6_9CHLR|nr:class I SAM-dependent methyltransferase [Chloroflexota bacterium]WJW69529.1 class I SAM-dependent methyltransferase [Chloroflexota bacterium L227-S17]
MGNLECIVCKNRQFSPLYKGVVKCEECGHSTADMELSDEELFTIYKKNYFFGEEYSDYLGDRKLFQRNFRLRFKTLQRFLQAERHKSLLEIGCAYGFFLEIAQPYFEIAKGIDITEDGVKYAHDVLKLDCIQADFLTHPINEQSFDVVCMWDTIEHLRNPHLYIEKFAKNMPKGGLLAITTGDLDSFNSRFRREKWRLIHPPTHLHYFSRKTLQKMLSNYGYEVTYNQYCGNYRSIQHAAHNLLVLGYNKPDLYSSIMKIGLTNLPLYFNLFDITYTIARKVAN